MKKIALFVMALMISVAANAQFEKGKGYLGASLSGFDMGSENKEFKFEISAKAGYLFSDDWMALGELGYKHNEHESDAVVIGAAARHYFSKNGIFVGGGLKYKHAESYNDLLPGVHAGYAFFLTRTVTLEPELYFDISTKNSKYTSYGLRIGVGVYLFKDQYQFKR